MEIKMQAVQAAVLKHMWVEVAGPWVQAPVFTSGFRPSFMLFSSEAQGTCLDKHIVTDRVLSVVKKCRKLIMPR
jgi:NADH dehydrogenase (ubiquinone) 1 alpha/beta subcomplex 1